MQEMVIKKVNVSLLEDNFVKALKDPYFVNVCNKLDCSEKIKMKYTSSLMDIANNYRVCSECKNLDKCPFDPKGLFKTCYNDGDLVKFKYIKCPYKEKYDKKMKHLEYVDVYKMPKAIMEASFKEIYKEDNNRFELIKELKSFYDLYLKNKSCKGIYVHGNFGCGKTFLVSALFNELAKKEVRSTIIYFPELLRSLKESFNSEDGEYTRRFDSVKYAPLLLLDDIGAEKLSEWARDEVLGVILQYRMDEKLPTFFTSNLSLDELESSLILNKSSVDAIKARRIIERIKFLCSEIKMISVNRRN